MAGRWKKHSVFLFLLLFLLPGFLGAGEAGLPTGTESDPWMHTHTSSITILTPLDGLGEESIDDGLIQAVASSDGSIGVIVKPTLSFGPFTTRLAFPLKGRFKSDPFDFQLDFSDWIPPERGAEETSMEHALQLLRHYSRFVQTLQFGNPYDPVYLRYGKLLGPTLGDGALVSGYVDRSVGLLTSRPGLDLMVDTSALTGVASGFHLLVDDLFEPTMKAWRVHSAPFHESPRLSSLELGFSHGTGRRTFGQRMIRRHFFVLDFAFPIFDSEGTRTGLFLDLLFQGADISVPQEGIGARSGINGRLGRFVTYSFALTAPLHGEFYADFFSSEWAIEDELQLLLPLGTSRFESLVSFTLPKQEIFFGAKIASDLADGAFTNTRLFANLRFDRFLFNLLSLDLRYEKLYPNERDGSFFDELMTLRMVDIQALAIIKVKPYVISLGVSLAYDEHTHLTSTIDAVVRIVLL